MYMWSFLEYGIKKLQERSWTSLMSYKRDEEAVRDFDAIF